jgi:transcription elongation GreA/GreB family factor
MSNENEITINIDDQEYRLDDLSENAKAQLASIHFVDERILQLQNELAVADTARIGYTNALKNEFKSVD